MNDPVCGDRGSLSPFGASRQVLDSVSLLEMRYDDQAKRRNEIYEFASRLEDAGVTALLTSEAPAQADLF